MALNPKTWYPIAVILCVVNVVGAAAATATGDPGEATWLHVGAHTVLAVGFGLWAQRLRLRRDTGRDQTSLGTTENERLELLEDDLTRLRQELSETQERLDFAERMLAQRQDPRRVEPQR